MSLVIEPLSEPHFEALRETLDSVARERRYLALFQAPPRDAAFNFYRGLVQDGQCHVALLEGRVVGWCDIQGSFGEARQHVGTLGIGLLPLARQRGVGRQLMQTAIEAAWARGLTRINLTVRLDNLNAKALYEQLGFQAEGVQRQSMCVDGVYLDCLSMALLKNDD